MQRIQNKTLYQQYESFKERLLKKNGVNIEMNLFHGTTGDQTIEKICSDGFNRNYCGKNGYLSKHSLLIFFLNTLKLNLK